MAPLPLSSPGLTGRSSTPWRRENNRRPGVLDHPPSRVMTGEYVEPSWHRKAQRLATAAHVDCGKARNRKPARAAIALFVDLELALAGAELRGAAPVQRPVLVLHGAVLGIDRLRKAE